MKIKEEPKEIVFNLTEAEIESRHIKVLNLISEDLKIYIPL